MKNQEKLLVRPEFARGLTTIEEALEFLNARLSEGHRCPVCNQFTKVYRRSLNSSMARSLIALYHHYEQPHIDPESWVSIRPLLARYGLSPSDGISIVAHWQMIEAKPTDESDKTIKSLGLYRITNAGRAFVRGETSVPIAALIFDTELMAMDTSKNIVISEALGKKFDYSELMQATPIPARPAAPPKPGGERIASMDDLKRLWTPLLRRLAKLCHKPFDDFWDSAKPFWFNPNSIIIEFMEEDAFNVAVEIAKQYDMEAFVNQCLDKPRKLEFNGSFANSGMVKNIVAKEIYGTI